jgi:hypothetical protein
VVIPNDALAVAESDAFSARRRAAGEACADQLVTESDSRLLPVPQNADAVVSACRIKRNFYMTVSAFDALPKCRDIYSVSTL